MSMKLPTLNETGSSAHRCDNWQHVEGVCKRCSCVGGLLQDAAACAVRQSQPLQPQQRQLSRPWKSMTFCAPDPYEKHFNRPHISHSSLVHQPSIVTNRHDPPHGVPRCWLSATGQETSGETPTPAYRCLSPLIPTPSHALRNWRHPRHPS